MKKLIRIDENSGIPLIGHIAFGVIDRGTNLIQIRATTICPLNCIFCSTDSGPFSKTRITDYIVELNYLMKYVKFVIDYKECNDIEAHIDSVGEPASYKRLVDLVREIRKIKNVKIISMQTHGSFLDKKKIDDLKKAGIDRINLSIDSMNEELAKKISGTPNYNVRKVIELAKYVSKSRIKLMLTPIWLPGINDDEIKKIIEFGKELGASFGIQKYEKYKLGRKPKEVKPVNWWKFYNQLKKWEKEFGVKLIIGRRDFNIHRTKSLPIIFRKGEKVKVKIVAQGWVRGEMLGVADDRVITIVDCKREEGETVKAKIISNKHNIYIAKL